MVSGVIWMGKCYPQLYEVWCFLQKSLFLKQLIGKKKDIIDWDSVFKMPCHNYASVYYSKNNVFVPSPLFRTTSPLRSQGPKRLLMSLKTPRTAKGRFKNALKRFRTVINYAEGTLDPQNAAGTAFERTGAVTVTRQKRYLHCIHI